MPTTLPNGVVVFNATPHTLNFLCEDQVVVAESDGIVNALPVTKTVDRNGCYELITVHFIRNTQGKATLREFRNVAPDGLVVGSLIAAQAYPGEVVAAIPAYSDRINKTNSERRLVRSDRFTIFRENNDAC